MGNLKSKAGDSRPRNNFVDSVAVSAESLSAGILSTSPSPAILQTIRECLPGLPVGGNEEMREGILDTVASQVVVKEVGPRKTLLRKGDTAKGLFVIIKGSVNVMSSGGEEVLATLHEGDYFGEVSVMFNTQCSARIQTETNCILAHLDPQTSRRLLGGQGDPDVLDWFADRRYLPTMEGLDADRAYTKMALKCLQQTSVFEKWSEAALKSLILQIGSSIVVVYPPDTPFVVKGDPLLSLFIVIRGRAVIKEDGRDIGEITVGREPVVVGEESMILGRESHVTFQTKICCQIIQIREAWIRNVAQEFPGDAGRQWKRRQASWKNSVDKRNSLYIEHPGLLQYEVLFHFLKNSPLFSECSDSFVHQITLQGIPELYRKYGIVCRQSQYGSNTVVLVLKGEVELVTELLTMPIAEGGVFCRCEWMAGKGNLVATSDCLVLKIPDTAVREALSTHPGSHLTFPEEPT